MVAVAQLAEHLSVEQDVAGSSPVSHPSIESQSPKTVYSLGACASLTHFTAPLEGIRPPPVL